MEEDPGSDIGGEFTVDNEEASTSTSTLDTTAPPAKIRRGGRYSSDESPVWDHFVKNTMINGQEKNKCRYCSFSTKDKTPGNLQKHLKNKHPNAFKEVETKIADKRPAASSTLVASATTSKSISFIQTKITQPFPNKKPYDKDSEKYKELISAVSLLFASHSLPHLLIQSPEFKYFAGLMDSKFELPTRRQLPKSIEKLYETIKERIRLDLANVQKVCVVLDGWSKKGLSEKYLGVLIKYFEPISKERKSALIGLQKMEGRSTAQNAYSTLQKVLTDWNIDEKKILFYITDNGSDMVCALKDCVVEFAPICQEKDIETEIEDMIMFEEGDVNLDASFMEEEANNDLIEFDQLEDDHNLVFGYAKRIACIAHQLMRVVRQFIDQSRDLSPIIKSALTLVNKINKSTNNKSLLLKYNNRGLLSPSDTRWVYTYYVLERLIESKEAVEKVILENELSSVVLNALQWKEIEQLKDLLAPFAAAVNKLEGDSYCTLSKVVPTLINIISKMENRGKKKDCFGIVALQLQRELEKRFNYILSFSSPNFQPAYLLATFLDLNFVKGLSKDQRDNCIRLLITALMQNDDDDQIVDEPQGTISESIAEDMEEYSGFFNRNPQVQATVSTLVNDRSKLFKMKLENYVEEAITPGACTILGKEKSIAYWLSKKDLCPEIANYAINLLTVPASSAGIERVFSLAAIVQNRRYRLGAESTERELMIKVNRGFLMNDTE